LFRSPRPDPGQRPHLGLGQPTGRRYVSFITKPDARRLDGPRPYQGRVIDEFQRELIIKGTREGLDAA
jgi:hypothetical protein